MATPNLNRLGYVVSNPYTMRELIAINTVHAEVDQSGKFVTAEQIRHQVLLKMPTIVGDNRDDPIYEPGGLVYTARYNGSPLTPRNYADRMGKH